MIGKLNRLAMLSVLVVAVTTSQALGMEKNLAGVPELQKSRLQQSIVRLADGQKDAYPLSVPLIASAQHGDTATYRLLLKKVNTALTEVDKVDAFRAWILGRVLFAADSIHDRDTVKATERELAQLLADEKLQNLDPGSLDHAMVAWAYGYFAGVSRQNYEQMKVPMLLALSKLEFAARQDTSGHDRVSNAVWAAVLVVNASANVQDREIYDDTLSRLKAIGDKGSVSSVLETALTRTADSSDYPAWTIGMVRVSATTMRDRLLESELAQPLRDAIRQAREWAAEPEQTGKNQWKAESEVVLGELSELLIRSEQTGS